MSLFRLGDGVEDGVAQAVVQPQSAVEGFHHLLHAVGAQGSRILLERIKCTETVAVVTAQAEWRRQPHESARVAQDAVHLRVRQSVARVEPAEPDIWDNCLRKERQKR